MVNKNLTKKTLRYHKIWWRRAFIIVSQCVPKDAAAISITVQTAELLKLFFLEIGAFLVLVIFSILFIVKNVFLVIL